MLVLIVILLSTSQVFAKYNLRFMDPILPQYLNNEKSIEYRLGSMTPYHPPQKTCSPSKALFMMRHGAKYPKTEVKDDIDKLNEFKTYFNNHYIDDDKALDALPIESKIVIRKIMKWTNKTNSAAAKELNDHGLLSMQKLGKRWNSKLINIVANIEREEDIEFNSAKEERCKKSGEEFLKEFLKIKKKLIVENLPPVQLPEGKDHRIKLDKGKPEEKDRKAKSSEEEVENIYYNKVCPEKDCYLKSKIRNLLFPNGSIDLEEWHEKITTAKIKAMYMACANSFVYDYSDDEEGHAWCSLFDINDIIMFEGMHDYQYYIKNGYHDTKIMNFGQPLMNDMLKFLNKSETKKFKLFAAHTSNCLSLITGFRLFRDEKKLTLENMTEGDKMSHRKWRSSFIGNYACNIMFVVYDCEDAENQISQEVSIYLNETPLEMVFENERTCTQCPINDVINLINELLKDTPTVVNELNEHENVRKRKITEETIHEPMIISVGA